MGTFAPMTKVESLAFVAYRSLVASGKSENPTLHDIATAVVRAAPLLEIVDTPDAIQIELGAVKMLCEKTDWADKKIVVSLDHFRPRADRLAKVLAEIPC